MHDSEQPPIDLRAVSAGYAGRPVLRDLTAHLPHARVTALVGPNGAGKSTLLSVLAGVLAPLAGGVTGLGPGRPALVVQRSSVPDTLPLTVREAVGMGRWADLGLWRRRTARDRELVEDAMARLGVTDLAGRQLGSLSGGQRQRVLVAQALAQRPGLLLLDEPTSGLDQDAHTRIADVLDAAGAEGVTVVHATHDMNLALRADHCLLLGRGRLLAAGPPEEVLTSRDMHVAWGLPAAEETRPAPAGPPGRAGG
ncbi:zinc ABC transporter ATP-binding protein AztA [Streptomyces marincola]|uniref:ABC transporter domain-containing protein n=1 Tax=Streptomyces marincola TaxID=2878388 RepID=A0A1W7D4T8_9ACTN|nr:zinc ABC transporter ATP-binding protein AztA [Streptomyces marincola]ARQ72002.1 hypothetical protein CAG99_27045 [Streptomyces marincola]